MTEPTRVRVGIAGAGFIADTRLRCYRMVRGARADVVAVATRTADSARSFASRWQIPHAFDDFEALLARPDIDVVDLCVPNLLHRPMTEAAARAGKHVICTKPLTAYVGQDLGGEPDDAAISGRDRREMLRVATADARAMVEACAAAGVKLMYAENWLYAPSIRRCAELVRAARGAVLEMRGWECHNGSHSPYSKLWRYTGGGALLRLGAHPVGAMIWLKRIEGLARDGRPIPLVSVTAEVADLSRVDGIDAAPCHVATGWQDVENWGCAVLAFADGSRGVVRGADTLLGGMESKLEVYASNCHLKCNLSPNDLLRAYAPQAETFGDEYIIEKSSTSAGWSTPMPNEDWTSGQAGMIQAFVAAVADGAPVDSDGELGLEVTRAIYAAYVAASEGRRVEIER